MWKSSKRLPKTSLCPVLIRLLLSFGMPWCRHKLCCRLSFSLVTFMPQAPEHLSGKWTNKAPDSNLCVAGRRNSLHPYGATSTLRHPVFFSIQLLFYSPFFKSGTNHLQTCCTWLISSPNRSKSPSTQAPFCRHFCTVSSCPRSPACTRRDAIWEGKTTNRSIHHYSIYWSYKTVSVTLVHFLNPSWHLQNIKCISWDNSYKQHHTVD